MSKIYRLKYLAFVAVIRSGGKPYFSHFRQTLIDKISFFIMSRITSLTLGYPFGGTPNINFYLAVLQKRAFDNSHRKNCCGESRIRTCEGENQQIYSLSSLAA